MNPLFHTSSHPSPSGLLLWLQPVPLTASAFVVEVTWQLIAMGIPKL